MLRLLAGDVGVSDGMGVQFKVERLDTACDPNSSTRLAAGDMLIPFTVRASYLIYVSCYLKWHKSKFENMTMRM